ncbi:hypothetical protein Q1695_005849 [Nippostrongylus brasiliensis]|nr:hypothetical protein Q1695_005849 [Nippostrongylus brasiliensis]
MYRDSMANGFAATVLFLIFLFLLARHIRKMRSVEDQQLPTVNPTPNLPPPYMMPPPPTYSFPRIKALQGNYSTNANA